MTFRSTGGRRERTQPICDLPIEPVLTHYGADVPEDLTEIWVSMLCPFHSDRRASARVNETGFACLGCMVKGNALSLIKEVEQCDWRSAIAKYEEITGRKLQVVRDSTSRFSRGELPPREGDYEESSGFFSPRLRRRASPGG